MKEHKMLAFTFITLRVKNIFHEGIRLFVHVNQYICKAIWYRIIC